MTLKRKSDNLLLTDHVTMWSDWTPRYNAPVIDTIMFVPYVQPIGVAIRMAEIRAVFADHYAGSTDTKFWQLVAAHRKNLDLLFTDQRGNSSTVRVLEVIESEIEENVKTKPIRYATIRVFDPAYIL